MVTGAVISLLHVELKEEKLIYNRDTKKSVLVTTTQRRLYELEKGTKRFLSTT